MEILQNPDELEIVANQAGGLHAGDDIVISTIHKVRMRTIPRSFYQSPPNNHSYVKERTVLF